MQQHVSFACYLLTSLTRLQQSTRWFSKTVLELLCMRVKIRFLSMFPRKGVEKLLRSIHGRFEKLKELEILNSIHGQNIEDLDVNKGLYVAILPEEI